MNYFDDMLNQYDPKKWGSQNFGQAPSLNNQPDMSAQWQQAPIQQQSMMGTQQAKPQTYATQKMPNQMAQGITGALGAGATQGLLGTAAKAFMATPWGAVAGLVLPWLMGDLFGGEQEQYATGTTTGGQGQKVDASPIPWEAPQQDPNKKKFNWG